MMKLSGKYNVAPCPFCGSKEDLFVDEERVYVALYNDCGGATLSIYCDNCDVHMFEHSVEEKNYQKKVEALLKKWNRRYVVYEAHEF